MEDFDNGKTCVLGYKGAFKYFDLKINWEKRNLIRYLFLKYENIITDTLLTMRHLK